jgi:hypothetical protein
MKAVGLDGSRGTKDDLPRTAVLLPYACSGDFDGNGKTDVTALLMIAGKKTLRAFHQYPQGSYTETIVEKESTAHDL